MHVRRESLEHPEPATARISRFVPLMLLCALFAIVVRSALAPLANADTYFHLRFGHEFLSSWSLRHPGSVSSLATEKWVPTQWLPEIVMAKSEDWFGLAGVAWLTGLQLLAYAVALFVACRRRSSLTAAVTVTLLAFVASGDGLSARPQVLSYLLVVITTDAWLRTRDDGRVRLWLAPTTWVWAMVHGMWPVGILIGVVAVVGGLLDRQTSWRQAGREAAVPLLSLVAAGLTPVGPSLYGTLVAVGGRAQYISEWGPTDFSSVHPMVLLAMFATFLLVRLRSGGTTWTHTLLFVLAGSWAIYAERTVPVAAALLAPLLAQTLQTVLPERDPVTGGERRFALVGSLATLVVLAAVLPSASLAPKQDPWLDSTLDALPAHTTLISDWARGGYLMWRHPQLDIGMHGYVDTYTVAEIDQLANLLSAGPGWEEELGRTGATYALLRPGTALAGDLETELGWQVVQRSADLELLRAPSAGG